MRSKKQDPNYKFLGKCPICNTRFSADYVSPIEENNETQMLYVECAKCKSSVVLGVMQPVPGLVTTVGMLTDMRREDIDRFRDLPPLTSDDVLEVHTHLERL